MSLVALKIFPAVNAAYQTQKTRIGASIASVHNKLNGLETAVPAALVQDTGEQFKRLVTDLHARCAPLLPGYRVKMVDSKCLAGTEHRLAVLHDKGAGCLPGKSLVVYEPAYEMATAVLLCTDCHAQERSQFGQLEEYIEAGDVVVMDRNFRVLRYLLNIAERGDHFITRLHKQTPYRPVGTSTKAGITETGTVYEQAIEVAREDGTMAI